jgi:transposase
MIGVTRAVRVFAYGEPVDLRKGFNGLSGLVEKEMNHQLVDGDVYLFLGRNPRRTKVLYFDGTGLCLLSKRLETGGRFARLWRRSGDEVLTLTLSELSLFLEGSELIERKSLAPPSFDEKNLAVKMPL